MDCKTFYEGNKKHNVKESNWEIGWSDRNLSQEKLHLS